MTLDQAIANMSAAQDALEAPCAAFKAAQRAYDRSRSKKNTIALLEARDAFDAAIALADAARDACERAEKAAAREAQAQRAAAEAHAQPSLF
jgi:hypothetical protein